MFCKKAERRNTKVILKDENNEITSVETHCTLIASSNKFKIIKINFHHFLIVI